jgi:hypothetical protein
MQEHAGGPRDVFLLLQIVSFCPLQFLVAADYSFTCLLRFMCL